MTIYTQTRRRERFLEELTAPFGDAAGAMAPEAVLTSPVSSFRRAGELSEAMRGPEGQFGPDPAITRKPPEDRLDAETARDRIKQQGLDLQVPDEGIPEGALDILIDRKKQERRRRDVLNRAPEGIAPMAGLFGVGLAASMLDPLNLASAFVPVVGPTRYSAMLARQAGRMGRIGVRSGVGAVEGAAGAALVEPIVLGAATQEQADYDLTDSMLNIALGTALGGGLHVGTGAVADVLARRANRAQGTSLEPLPAMLDELPFETREAALRTSVAQAVTGRRIDVEPVLDTAGVMSARFGPEVRVAVSDIAMPGDRFHGAPQPMERPTSEHFSSLNYYGQGFYTTDASAVARGYAGRRGATQPTVYRITETAPIKAFDMEQAVPDWLIAPERAEPDAFSQVTDIVLGAMDEEPTSVRAFYDEIREFGTSEGMTADEIQEIFDMLRSRVEEQGFNAMDHMGGLRTGKPPHKVRIYLDPESTVTLDGMESPQVDVRDAASANQAPEAVRLADFDAARAADERMAETPADEAFAEQSLSDTMAEMQELAAALDDPDVVARELAPFDDLANTADEYGKAVRAAANCQVRKGDA